MYVVYDAFLFISTATQDPTSKPADSKENSNNTRLIETNLSWESFLGKLRY